jgi:hypothetical protein
MKKIELNNLNIWWLVTLVVIYMVVMNQFTEYIVNTEVNTSLQGIYSIVSSLYTVIMLKIVINNVERWVKKNKNII